MRDEFIFIGQHMADGDGVVLLVGKPIKVNLREESSTKRGDSVTLTAALEPGYTKIRAATFAEAMRLWRGQQQGPTMLDQS